MAEAWKDAEDGEGIKSPIFAHKDFERLEVEGQARLSTKHREPSPGGCANLESRTDS